MIGHFDWQGKALSVDFSRGQSIAIPLDPQGSQPSFFTDRPATATPLRSGDYIGDVGLGGSCNAQVVELVPHCHGTHTECRGHIVAERITVQDCIYAGPALARLISLTPENARENGHPEFAQDSLAAGLRAAGEPEPDALVIRTLPNDAARQARDYAAGPAYPVLSRDAMGWLASLPLKHLLLDAPSLDRAHDGGRLENHRTWWGMDRGPAPEGVDAGRRSVTEMIFVSDSLPDGLYWLQLELSPLVGDATPSRPILYPVKVGR